MYETFADDEDVPVVEYRDRERATVVTDQLLAGLRVEAESAQRLVVSRLVTDYVPGRMELAMTSVGRVMTPQKMFSIPKLVEWMDGDPVALVDAMRVGRLRCRLSARMGIGKSTRLAPYCAREMSFRVLLVGLNTQSLQESANYMRELGLGKVRRRWSSVRKPAMSYMTYHDFNGHMMKSSRADLFKSFELIIMDEAGVNAAQVFCAKMFFSVYAAQHTHLVLCSATIRTDSVEGDGGSASMGAFQHLSSSLSVEDAIRSGKLITKYITDRTLVVVPTDGDIAELAEHYASNGVDVRTMDRADSHGKFSSVCDWLQGDATTPRVLVAHSMYAIAMNAPVAYSVIWPYIEKLEFTDTAVSSVIVPMSSDMVVQAMGRTGRGIVDGSGGVIMSPERSDDVELPMQDRMTAFVTLCAGSVAPLRTDFWSSCYEVFPSGLTPNVAQNILKVSLPVEIVVRYLGSDGKLASKYCAALSLFAQPDHFPMASVDELPASFHKWSVDRVGLGESVDDGFEEIKVPFLTEGELKVIVNAVEMISQGRMSIPRWRPANSFIFDDGYDSGEDMVGRESRQKFIRLRRIDDVPYVEPKAIEAPVELTWKFKAVEGPTESKRSGGFIDSARCKQALLALEASLLEYRVPKVVNEEVIESDEGTVVPVVTEGYGDVESPGGSVVCSLPVRVCEKMNTGKDLTGDEMLRVVSAARVDADRFVASKLFDCFSGPWDSILHSLLNEAVAVAVVRGGVASDTYAIVDKLRARFGVELCSVMATSHVFKSRFNRYFGKSLNVDSMMRAIKKGKFDGVAQTNGFLSRVRELKSLIDTVLVKAERNNIYLPTYITNSQRRLPFRPNGEIGYVGQDVDRMPVKVAKKIEEMMEGHRRGDSDSSAGDGRFDRKNAGW